MGPWLLALFVFVVCGSGVNISTCAVEEQHTHVTLDLSQIILSLRLKVYLSTAAFRGLTLAR